MNWAKLAAWPRRYLWQAPRGAVLKHTRNSDKILNTHIAGKSIAVVGNAQSLFDAEFGTEIDAHDIVIRLNKGFVKSPLAQGHRTDFWGLTPELSEAEMQDQFDPKVILFLIPKLRHLRIYRPQNVAKLLFYARRYWLQDRNLIGRRPSSGFMAISYLLRLDAAKSITLYGFDFGATGTYYNPNDYKTPHNYAREAKIILGWEREGRIKIMRPT